MPNCVNTVLIRKASVTIHCTATTVNKNQFCIIPTLCFSGIAQVLRTHYTIRIALSAKLNHKVIDFLLIQSISRPIVVFNFFLNVLHQFLPKVCSCNGKSIPTQLLNLNEVEGLGGELNVPIYLKHCRMNEVESAIGYWEVHHLIHRLLQNYLPLAVIVSSTIYQTGGFCTCMMPKKFEGIYRERCPFNLKPLYHRCLAQLFTGKGLLWQVRPFHTSKMMRVSAHSAGVNKVRKRLSHFYT